MPSSRRGWIATAVAAALVAACTGSRSPDPGPSNTPAPAVTDAKDANMPTVASFADIRLHTGKQVFVVGRYEVQDTGRHKIAYTKPDGSTGMTNKVARIAFDDGHGVDLWVRPDDELKALHGKMVVASGKLIAAGDGGIEGAAEPDASPSLVQIASVREADK